MEVGGTITLMYSLVSGALAVLIMPIMAASPSSTNFTLKAYEVGSGGGAGSSASYKVDGFTNSVVGNRLTSTNYAVKPAEIPTQDTNVPPAPALTNPSSFYNRLRLVLATGNNPSDTKFAIAISPDAFATTNYVKSDTSIGNSLAITDYQSFVAWGGASGFDVVGLQPNTTYQVKVTAFQGAFSQSAYGPTASAATVQPLINFSVATSLSGTPPYTSNFASLPSNTIVNANADIILTITSNAQAGGHLYVRSLNGGLNSLNSGFSLSSATADLIAAGTGYGAIITAISQSSGGPITGVAPFNGGGNNVGQLSNTIQAIAYTSAPITVGSLTMQLRAKADSTTPAETDYTDALIFIAAMSF